MPIDETILKIAQALVAPISAAAPSGQNPAADERYQELRVEVNKENTPTGEVEWPRVAELGTQILQNVAKDLLVAAYTAHALYKTRGLPGLAVGFVAVDLLFERHWDTMFPPLSRIRGRGTAICWLLDHADGALANVTATPDDRVVLGALIDASNSLRHRARDKLGDHCPSFRRWTDRLEILRSTLPPEAAAPRPEHKPANDPRTLATPWLAPIAGDKGSEVTTTDEYQTVLAEVDRLQSPTGGAIDWAHVIRQGDIVLKHQTKDLRIACHLALARYRTARIAGLAVGLAVVAELADAFWDTMQPPRPRTRRGALMGLLNQIEPELAAHVLQHGERSALTTLEQAATRLQAVIRARFADQALNLRLLLETIEQLATTEVVAPAPTGIRTFLTELRHDPTDPRPSAPPGMDPVLPAPNPHDRTEEFRVLIHCIETGQESEARRVFIELERRYPDHPTIARFARRFAPPGEPATRLVDLTETRYLEVALARRLKERERYPLHVLIRLEGTAPLLERLRQKGIRKGPLGQSAEGMRVPFAVGADGRLMPLVLLITVRSGDFECEERERRISLAPGQDPPILTFIVTPCVTGNIHITVEAQVEGAVIGSEQLARICLERVVEVRGTEASLGVQAGELRLVDGALRNGLRELLLALFTRSDDLHRWVSLYDESWAQDLPNVTSSANTMAFAVMDHGLRRGFVDPTFFERLAGEFPRRRTDIDRVRDLQFRATPPRLDTQE